MKNLYTEQIEKHYFGYTCYRDHCLTPNCHFRLIFIHCITAIHLTYHLLSIFTTERDLPQKRFTTKRDLPQREREQEIECQRERERERERQAAQCSLVQNIYFGLQKIGSLCPKNRRKIGNYRPKMAFL